MQRHHEQIVLSCERFQLLSERAPEPRMRTWYGELFASEARHHRLFASLAEHHQLAKRRADAFRMVQLAWPDPKGALPWEPAFAVELRPVQLLLGDPPG